MKKIISIIVFLLFTQTALAHQPRIVDKEITIVENPEISQAFYGELKGEPEYFQIKSDIPFRLYVGILVPDVPDIGKDVSVLINKQDGGFEKLLDGVNFTWTPFYEEFGNDNYFWGQEFKDEDYKGSGIKGKEVEAGTYDFKIFSPDDMGKYVFVVGDIESFPIGEILNTIKTMPELKSDFFGKSALSAFNNKIGMFIFGPVILLIILVGVIIYMIRRRERRYKHL